MDPIQTLIPNHSAIELVAYYPKFIDYYPECELQTKRWFVEHVEPNWIILDAGANIGYYSILFSKLAPNGWVYAFEPTETIQMLRANLAHNDCSNVTPLEIALGSTSGTREENVFKIWGEEPERRAFEFSTVDDMVSRLELERLDCIKIDVDSFDLDVLRGAEETLRDLDPWIVVELSDALLKRGQTVREALEWLYSRGYRRAHIVDAENYVFRRKDSVGNAERTSASLLLSFDTQPLLISPRWIKGDVVEGVFEREPRRHNTATIAETRSRVWSISVPGPQWSYAASWPRSAETPVPDPLIVEVIAESSGGPIGIGCVSRDGATYIGEEVVAKPLPALQRLTILTEGGHDLGALVIRNADPTGTPSLIRIQRIESHSGVAAAFHPSALLSSKKSRISLAECSAALRGEEPSFDSKSSSEPGIDIVPIAELGATLGFANAYVPDVYVYRHTLADFRAEVDERALYSYLYREFQPKRYLEVGPAEAWTSDLCAAECAAEICKMDSPGSVDCALIAARSDVRKVKKDSDDALRLVRSGGLVLWQGFCPDVETLRRNEVPRGVVTACVENCESWRPLLSRWFWIRPSWLMIGVKR